MTADKRPPSERADGDDWSWFDGLTGREGAGSAHAEGAALHAALSQDDGNAAPKPTSWGQVVTEAEQQSSGAVGQTQEDRRLAKAANESHWRALQRWGSLAACLVAGLGAVMTITQPSREAEILILRGVAGAPEGTEPGAWQVEKPVAAAQALVDNLRSAGATVSVSPRGSGFLVEVAHAGPNVDAVSATLASVKAGLDSTGRARVLVMPSRELQ